MKRREYNIIKRKDSVWTSEFSSKYKLLCIQIIGRWFYIDFNRNFWNCLSLVVKMVTSFLIKLFIIENDYQILKKIKTHSTQKKKNSKSWWIFDNIYIFQESLTLGLTGEWKRIIHFYYSYFFFTIYKKIFFLIHFILEGYRKKLFHPIIDKE